jgi:hypothetical protein
MDSKLNTKTTTHIEPRIAHGRFIGLLSHLFEKNGSAKKPKYNKKGPANIT